MGSHKIHVLLSLAMFGVIIIKSATTATQIGLPGCPTKCGDIDIPYPFGFIKGCYLNRKFFINCSTDSFGNSKPLLGKNLFVSNISIKDDHEISVLSYTAKDCYRSGKRVSDNRPWIRVPSFTISNSKNKFTLIGCDSYAYVFGFGNISTGCSSRCPSINSVPNDGSCSGVGCCQIDIPEGLKNMTIDVFSFRNHTAIQDFNNCSYAFVVEKNKFKFSRDYLYNYTQERVPLVLDWGIANDACLNGKNNTFCPCGPNSTRKNLKDKSGYHCMCKKGYDGFAYLPEGCKDVNECENSKLNNCSTNETCVNNEGNYTCVEQPQKDQLVVIKVSIGAAVGFLALLISISWLHLVIKKRKLIKLKEQYFQQNGGLILQQQFSQHEDPNQMAKIFSEEELRKATLNFHESTIIGRGGFGIVYKGVLTDNKIVAIKKAKFTDQNQTDQFINEVVVLSQINHRNVVKLLGCCLETEIPLLVYEYIPNGTLFEHIHNKDKASNINWETRLAIAIETAGALAYLHSAASTPIIHRDVKSSNILLDNYTAKVSDFGASKLIPLDQTGLATMVQGTLGYLDPEYLHTNQLTDKSDVYSFGVVLVELLTGKKALSFDRPEEERSLVMYFLSSLKEGRIFDVLESHIVNEGKKQLLQEVSEIAKSCLNVKGEDRPTMKEVAMELEGLIKMDKHPWHNNEDHQLLNLEETKHLLAETYKGYHDTDHSSNTDVAYDSTRECITLDFSGR